MIGTVTLNPCIDRTISLNHLDVGEMNRMVLSRRDVSGKGINVSIALRNFGIPVKSCGFIYEGNKDFFLSSLIGNGIEFSGIEVPGILRENLKIWDQSCNITTEINQSGEYVSEDKWNEFKCFFRTFISDLELLILSGSVPKGIRVNAYKELMEIAEEEDIPVFLDAEGELLLEGLSLHPVLIKPNLYEFRKTFSLDDYSIDSIARKAQEVSRQYGIRYVFVSLGKDGALLISDDGAIRSPALDIPVKSTQGAGDAFVSGAAKAFVENGSGRQMLSYGMAASASAVMKEGTEMCDLSSFLELLPSVKIEEIGR